jgi:hypothetical protein
MHTGNVPAARGRVKCRMVMRVFLPETFGVGNLNIAKNHVLFGTDSRLKYFKCEDWI